ncbi:hypothetical protein SDC9_114806 [bioreactor metagenome]|uniref:Uncharacterized protein n=1 Tax=bioreactor metagenome TaxID=1076179 RepID=A0A645BTD9_9ZZZZ
MPHKEVISAKQDGIEGHHKGFSPREQHGEPFCNPRRRRGHDALAPARRHGESFPGLEPPERLEGSLSGAPEVLSFFSPEPGEGIPNRKRGSPGQADPKDRFFDGKDPVVAGDVPVEFVVPVVKTCPAPGPVNYLVVVVAGVEKNIGAAEAYLKVSPPPFHRGGNFCSSEGGGEKLEISSHRSSGLVPVIGGEDPYDSPPDFLPQRPHRNALSHGHRSVGMDVRGRVKEEDLLLFRGRRRGKGKTHRGADEQEKDNSPGSLSGQGGYHPRPPPPPPPPPDEPLPPLPDDRVPEETAPENPDVNAATPAAVVKVFRSPRYQEGV